MKKMLDTETRNLEVAKNKGCIKKFDISEAVKVYKKIYQDLC